MNAASTERTQTYRATLHRARARQEKKRPWPNGTDEPFAGQAVRAVPWFSPKGGGDCARTPLAHVASGVVAVATAATLACAPGAAFAATSGTTQVTLVADEEQMSVTVPSRLAVAVKSDGSFVTPDLAIQNNSVFSVHVSGIKATVADGFNLVGQDAFAESEGENTLWMSLTSSGNETIDLGSCVDAASATSSGKWVAERAQDGVPGQVTVSSDGAIKDFTRASADEQQALNVVFTIKAGN